MNRLLAVLGVIVAVGGVIAYATLYTVHQT